jgi:hypothetical protein
MPYITPGGVTKSLSPLSSVAAVASSRGVVQPPLALPERPCVGRTRAPEGSGERRRNTVGNVDPGQKPGGLGRNRGFRVAEDGSEMRQGAGDRTRQHLGIEWPSVSLQRTRKA